MGPMTQSALPHDLPDSGTQRRTMVDCQIRTFEVTDQRLIARVLEVPRERFVPDAGLAYSDTGFTLPAEGDAEARYMLPPLILVRLIQGGRPKASDRVLDVACGGGYSSALLAGLAAEVHVLETGSQRRATLEARLDGIGPAHIFVNDGDLGAGLPARATFDLILINGAVETGLDTLLDQLAEGGRLLCIRRGTDDPTGRAGKALCYEKRGGKCGSRYLFDASAPVLPAFKAPPAFVF